MNLNILFCSSIVLCITTFFIIIILLFYGKNALHRIYALFNFAIFAWALNAVIVSQIQHAFFSSLFFRLGSLWAHFTPILLLHLSYVWAKKYNYKILFLAYLEGCIVTFLLLGTDLIFVNSYITSYGSFWIPKPGALFLPWFIFWLLTVIFAHFPLIRFYSLQNIYEKKQLRYFFTGSCLGFLSGIFNFFIPLNYPWSLYGNFGIALYTIILAYAFLKYQLLGIEIVIRKSIFYTLLICTFGGIYLLLIMLIERLFKDIVGYKSILVSLISAFTIAFLFNPLRNKIQALIDKIFIGKTPQEIAKENELLRLELERSERLKTASTLALGLAHEVRNPLTTIKTFAEYLPEKYKDDEFVKKFSRIIPSEVERINSIVKQLLDFSKPTPPSYIDTNIHQLLNEILAFLNSEFLKKHIKVERFDEDQSMSVKIDPSQIKQALLNIILNALDAMPKGGILTIKTESSYDNNLRISISDTGCGIPKEDFKRIFDPFFSNKDTGTGLGLSIAYNIIQNHKGFIEVESEIRKGTIFIIKLPLERSEG